MLTRRPALTRASAASAACQQWLSPLLIASRKHAAWALAVQRSIAETAAPTGFEGARADLVQRTLSQTQAPGETRDVSHGVPQAFRDRTGNVLWEIAPPQEVATAPALVCMAHLDTVFPPDTPLIVQSQGSRLYCPGIGDNSRGVAALLLLSRVLQLPEIQSALRRPVVLVATVGEEGAGNLCGARGLFDDRAARGDATFAALAIDGPGDRAIMHHAIGSYRMRLHFRGGGGHSWANATVPNPAHVAGAVIHAIDQLARAVRPRATISVTRLGGGETLTSIPQHAWIDVDIRALEAAPLAQLGRQVGALAREQAQRASRGTVLPPIQVTTELLGDRPAGSLDARHPLVQLAEEITHAVGRAPYSASASTDANIPLALGIPAIGVGAGGTGGDAHTAGEWYDDTDSAIGLARLLTLTVALATTPLPQFV